MGKIVANCDFCRKEFEQYESKLKLYKTNCCSRYCSSRRSRNEFIIEKEITKIIINSKKYGKFECLIDTRNLERIKKYNWCVVYKKNKNTFHVENKEAGLIHRFITNYPDNKMIDHKDGNTFNNLEENLRICNNSENQQNLTKLRKNNKSGYRNVSWNDFVQKWQVQLQKDYKIIHFGYFDNMEEANKVAIKARAEYFPFATDI